jgi:hypothetical protein
VVAFTATEEDHMKNTKLATYAVGAVVAVAMTGCGGDDDGDASDFADQSAKEIIDASGKDMADLESVHLSADITNDGMQVTMDLSLDTSGNCEGSVAIGGGTAEIIRTTDGSWFKADDAFWQGQAGEQAEQIIGLVGDKWVVDPSDQFSSFCELESLLDDIGDPEGVEDATTDGTKEVDGKDAVKVVGDDDGNETTAFVAVDDPHYILKIEVTGDEESGEASFSDFNEDIEVEAPATEDVIDLP